MSRQGSTRANGTARSIAPGHAAGPVEPPDPVYDDMVRIAARACGTPFASLAIAGQGAHWCTQAQPLPAPAAPQDDPFLAHCAGAPEPLEVADVGLDARFCNAGFAVAGSLIRSYAGCTLRDAAGKAIGALAVYGTTARAADPAFRETLMLVARQAAALVELRTRLIESALLSDSPPVPAATESLEPSAAIAQALLESAPVAIYHAGDGGATPYVNPEYRSVFGITADKSIDDWAQAVHPADRARIEETWNDFSLNPRPMKFEYRVQSATGQVRYFREQLVRTARIAGFVGTISDFTDLVTARGNLHRAETRFHDTFDQAPIGIAYADRNGHLLRCNPAFCSLLAIGTGDLAATSFGELTHVDDRASSAAAVERLWKGEVDFVDLEKRYLRPDGSCVWVRATSALIRDEQGVPDCSVEFLRDISNRKELAESLVKQQTLLETVITDLPVGLVACDVSGRITHHNRAALELHCLDSSDGASQTLLSDGVTPVGARDMPLARALRGETISNLELVMVPTGGERRATLSSARRLVGPAGQILGAVAVVQDITERKTSEMDLERIHKELIVASRQAGMAEVATNVLHNVGNILNSINISASMVAERVKQSKAAGVSRLAAMLHEQGPRLGEFLTSDDRGRRIPEYLSALGQQVAEDQRMTLQEIASMRENLEHIKDTVAMQQSYAKLCGVTETVEVADLVEDSLRLNAGALTRHGVTLVREFAAVPAITVDKHKVLQILVNLIRNAKYACDESGKSDKRIVLRIESAGCGVRISVIDNGVGIAPENMDRLFNHGFTTRKSGHGFGLHSGALAAHDLGGTLHAESDGPGSGAAFVLELPLTPPGSHHA